MRTLFAGTILLFALSACDRDLACGDLEFDRAARRCRCPAGTVEADGGVCVEVDGGPMTGPDGCSPAPETCNGLDDDCDGDTDETAASAACAAVPGATRRACTAGACVVVECGTGREDCDGDYESGCEAVLATDAANCGACGTRCAAGETCEAGTCEPLPRFEWLREITPGAETAWASAVDVHEDSSICVGGGFIGSFTQVGRPFSSGSGDASGFVARLRGDGHIEWLQTINAYYALVDQVIALTGGRCLILARGMDEPIRTPGGTFMGTREGHGFAALVGDTWGSPPRGYGDWDPRRLAAGSGAVFAVLEPGYMTSETLTPQLARLDLTTLAPTFTIPLPRGLWGATVVGDEVIGVVSFSGTLSINGSTFSARGATDVLVARWSLDGEPRGAFTLGGDGADSGTTVARASTGELLVAGASERGGGHEAVIWVVPAAGETRTVTVASSPTRVAVSSLVPLESGLVATGVFSSPLTAGGESLTPRGSSDLFIARRSGDLDAGWAVALGSFGSDSGTFVRDRERLLLAATVGGTFTGGDATVAPAGMSTVLVAAMRAW